MIELEAKFKVTDLAEIERQLIQLKFLKGKTYAQNDVYFNSSLRDFGETDEALRIRTVNQGEKIELTYKGKKLSSESKSREEISVGIESSDKMEKILLNLGFKRVLAVEKYRSTFVSEHLEVALDRVTGLGTFVEIELEWKSEESLKEGERKLFETAEQLGLRKSDQIRTSYLEMLLEKS